MGIVKSLFFLYFAICVCYSFLFTSVRSKSVETDKYACMYNVKNDISSRNQPLFLSYENGKPTLYFPENIDDEGFVALKKGQELLVSCPGDDNEIVSSSKSQDISICVKKNEMRSPSKRGAVQPSDMVCKKTISAELKDTGKSCGSKNQAKIYEIGYNAYGWQKIITVCHDPKNMDTLYATHVLKGQVIKARAKSVPRLSKFEGGDLYEDTKIQNIYKKTNVQRVFETILGEKFANEYLDDRINFLAKGHLCPDADMVMASLKVATYYFANVAPQWQSINGKNWKHLEGLVRTAAARLKDDIQVETGTFGVLELLGENGYEKMYLGYPEKTIRIPKYFYKRLYYVPKKSAIVFITSNDPFLKETQKVTFCKNICKENGWIVGEEPSSGYTFCCTLESFREVVKDAEELDVTQIFKYPDLSELGKKFPEAARKIIEEHREKKNAAKNVRTPRKKKQDSSL